MTPITNQEKPSVAGNRSPATPIEGSVDDWLESLAGSGQIGALLDVPPRDQLERGYGHTLREICQQPVTWPETASTLIGRVDDLRESLAGVASVVVTGSGSSFYAAECAAPCLQHRLRLPAVAVPAGRILTHPEICLPPSGEYLVVSVARSGNSPESRGVVDGLLETDPRARHLAITCNRDGALATAYGDAPKVTSVVLDEKTDDESLVMTSSFTNLVVAARTLGALGAPERCASRTHGVARAAARVLQDRGDDLSVAGAECRAAVYLGSGCRLGAAHESGLKMLEMTAGEVGTMSESFLGLRHGPMSVLRKDTLVVAFLSSDPVVRAYEADLLRELDRKELGQRRVVVGAQVPPEVVRERDVVVDCGPARDFADEDLTVIDTLVGQLLAFFRCRAAGLRPDSPSSDGVITRVVSSFEIHRRDRHH